MKPPKKKNVLQFFFASNQSFRINFRQHKLFSENFKS